jgi:hypothetical protein
MPEPLGQREFFEFKEEIAKRTGKVDTRFAEGEGRMSVIESELKGVKEQGNDNRNSWRKMSWTVGLAILSVILQSVLSAEGGG